MQYKNKIAVFDFCETLVPFQSADKFIDFIYTNHKTIYSVFYHFLCRFLSFIRLLKIFNRFWPNLSIGKRLMLRQIKGITESEMSVLALDYYETCIRPNLINDVVSEFIAKKQNGYIIYIVSGGFDVYLQLFAKDYGISVEHVLCTVLEKKKGIYTGRFVGLDCMRANKVLILDKVISRNTCYVLAYSDSYSDLPLFQWADESYVVSKNNFVNWSNKILNLKKIIKWEK